jgi:hypothetical protein
MDDAFDDHEKVLALLDLDEGVAAIGLWTLCFTWAHRNTRKKGKTPGLLPSTLPRRFVGARGKELAALLVDAGMWDVEGDGWMIHDFVDYLPDKELSAARSEAGKKGAASRWGNRKSDGNLPSRDGNTDGKADGHGVANPASGEVDHTAAPAGSGDAATDGKLPSAEGNQPSVSHLSDGKAVASDGSRAGARWVRAGVGVSGSLRTSVTLPQAGPDPADPVAEGDGMLIDFPVSRLKRPEPGSDEDPDWLRFWDAYPRKASKQGARGKWAKAIRAGVDPNVIIAGAVRYADEMRRKRTPKDKIKHPDGWLLGKRWEDEVDTSGSRSFDDIEECAPEEFNS